MADNPPAGLFVLEQGELGEREFWLVLKRALQMIVNAIDRRYGKEAS